MSAKARELTTDNFASETGSGIALVDFWAPWCGPCKMQAPIMDEVAATLGEDALVAKVNVDDSPELAARFNIRGIPSMVLLKDGQLVEQLTGLRQAADLVKLVRDNSGQ